MCHTLKILKWNKFDNGKSIKFTENEKITFKVLKFYILFDFINFNWYNLNVEDLISDEHY